MNKFQSNVQLSNEAACILLEKYLDSEQKAEIQKFINQKTCAIIFNNLYAKNIKGKAIQIPESVQE